jgi:U3 small nucleolar RNA-associated protein 10
VVCARSVRRPDRICLTVTDNPQTFHQALLLIANLTRLARESVLHNIMPVFTFMGSNVFHRDDSYSFAVVQKVYNHIPRHRRVKFVSYFLGSSKLLTSLQFLGQCIGCHRLSSNKIVRQNPDDVLNALALPTSLLHHHNPHLQTFVSLQSRFNSRRTNCLAGFDVNQAWKSQVWYVQS